MVRHFPGTFMPRRRGGAARRVDVYGAVLFFQLLQSLSELDVKPPVTIAIIVANLFIFALPLLQPFMPRELRLYTDTLQYWTVPGRACLNPRRVLAGERWPLLAASFVHLSDQHVLYNLLSLVYKGVTLETALGSSMFFGLVVYLSFAAHAIYVGLAFIARELGVNGTLMNSCVAGFSGVLFGLKVVLNSDRRYGERATRIFGVAVPGGRSPWAELILVQVIAPNVSFLGHLSGILAGLIYVYVPRLLSRRLHRRLHHN